LEFSLFIDALLRVYLFSSMMGEVSASYILGLDKLWGFSRFILAIGSISFCCFYVWVYFAIKSVFVIAGLCVLFLFALIVELTLNLMVVNK